MKLWLKGLSKIILAVPGLILVLLIIVFIDWPLTVGGKQAGDNEENWYAHKLVDLWDAY